MMKKIKSKMMRRKINAHYMNADWTGKTVQKEVTEGIALLNSIENPILSIFGGHVKSKWYDEARRLGRLAGTDGWAIMTGGGPGIMEAANLGANDVKAPSIGFSVSLLKREQNTKAKLTHKYAFKFMFVRRFLLGIKSNAMVIFPGGFGTLNELSEYVDLMLIDITDKVPIILVGKEFWTGFLNWLKEEPAKHKLINKKDLKYFAIVDSVEEVYSELKKLSKKKK